MSNVSASAKPPGWVIEGPEIAMAHRHLQEKEALEERAEALVPGAKRIFRQLLRQLPGKCASHLTNTEFPVAAALVRPGDGQTEVLAVSTNQTNARGTHKAHAEFNVIEAIDMATPEKQHLNRTWLLSTLCPCPMCSGYAVNASVEGVIYGADHNDVDGKHALVNGEYKPWRVPSESYDITDSGLIVIGGFMRDEVLEQTKRIPVTMTEYYMDLDA